MAREERVRVLMRAWAAALLLLGSCNKEVSEPTVAPEPAAPRTTSAEVREFASCLGARLRVTEFKDDSIAAEIKGTLPALTGTSADETGERIKSRYADREDTCEVDQLVNRCVAFAHSETVDADAEAEALAACEEARAGEAADDADEEQETADAGAREPVLELFEHVSYNEGQGLARVIRLPGSCKDLSRPTECNATGRMQTFENVLSSYRLEKGYRAVFYDDTMFRGRTLRVPEDAGNAEPNLRKHKFDDVASSVQVFDPDGNEL
jgi:hypothetical protein